jgi:hypothetical protein
VVRAQRSFDTKRGKTSIKPTSSVRRVAI